MKRVNTQVKVPKKGLMLNLSEEEMTSLNHLAIKKGLSKSSLLRQAFRLYESIEFRAEKGEKFYFENVKNKEKSELVFL